MSFYTEHFGPKFVDLMRTPLGWWMKQLIDTALNMAQAEHLSLLGPCHVRVHCHHDPDTRSRLWVVIEPDSEDPAVLEGLVLELQGPGLDSVNVASITALLQWVVQGPYAHASDWDQARQAGWVPDRPVCPTCHKEFPSYDVCWSHGFMDHGRVQNPFHLDHACALVEPLL